MDMLLRGKLRRGVGLCVLLLAFVNEATGQRRKTRLRNNYKLQDERGNGDFNKLTGKNVCIIAWCLNLHSECIDFQK